MSEPYYPSSSYRDRSGVWVLYNGEHGLHDDSDVQQAMDAEPAHEPGHAFGEAWAAIRATNLSYVEAAHVFTTLSDDAKECIQHYIGQAEPFTEDHTDRRQAVVTIVKKFTNFGVLGMSRVSSEIIGSIKNLQSEKALRSHS